MGACDPQGMLQYCFCLESINAGSECKYVKMEAVHSPDFASCVPDYKELHLGETIITVDSTRISPLICSFILFYLFYFILFFYPIDNYKIIMDMSRNNWTVSYSNAPEVLLSTSGT
jgi:hypothetical protein